MEQTTTGKAPPPIAINQGGGIQILNMRGAAPLGATVVPSPGGSAQTATVVGSPGPPGKGGVGQRMIISPQMLANRGPGQPVEESDTESVNQCDDDNHELKSSESEPRDPPASITGVSSSSDLQHDACDVVTVEYSGRGSELQKDDVIMSDDDSNNISKASSDDFVVEKGSGQITDDNDLSLSNPSTVNKAVPGSPDNQLVNERSVSQCDDTLLSSTPVPSSEYSQSPPQPPSPSPNLSPNSDGDDQSSRGLLDSRPPSCDEHKNQDSSEVVMNKNVVNSPKSSSSTPQSRIVENLDSLGQVDSDSRMNIIDSNNSKDEDIVSNGAQKAIHNDVISVVEQKDENKKCTYNVPDADQEPVNTETETSENFRPDTDNSPSSDLGALRNNSNVDNSNRLSVQNNNSNQKANVDVCEKSFVPEEEKRCDTSDDNRDQQAFVTVTSDCDDLDNNSNSCSSVLNKCLNTSTESATAAVEEPPPLIREQRISSTDIIMGNNGSKEATTSTDEDPVDNTVDDVNLDMFSDSEAHDNNYGPMNSSNGAIHVERSSSSSRSPCASERHGAAEATRTSLENRPKLMDMHLADFIFMDCDDDEIESVHETTVPSPLNAPIAPAPPHQTWNTNTTHRLTHSTSLEHPFSPPKIISEIFVSNTTNNSVTQSIRTSTTTAGSTALSHNSQSNNLTFWSNSKSSVTEPSLGSQPTQQSPPSCAFQMYNVGQGHTSNNNHQIAARIPMRSDHQQQQHNSQHYQTSSSSSIRIPHSTAYTNYPNNISMIRNTGSSTGHLPQSNNLVSYPSTHRTDSSNASINSTKFPAGQNAAMGTSEYKSNYGQHNQQQQQNQTLFTNDPQLLSQFVQYTKHFPLGRGDKPQDQTQISSSSAPSSYSIPQSAITRGQYAHAPNSAAINIQQDKHSKALPIKPVVVNPHSQQQQHSHHPMSSIRQTTNASVPSHQRQQYSAGIPQQQHQYPQHPMHHQQQNSPFQSQYRSSSNLISANGCDNTSKSIGINPTIQQQVNSAAAVNFQNSSNYSVSHSHGQSYAPTTASQNVRQSLGPVGGATGTFYPPPSTTQSQQMHIRQQQQHSNVPVQKELSSCSYANTSTAGTAGTRSYNPSQLNQPNFAGANPAGSHNNTVYQNVGYNSNTLSSGTARMSHSQNQQHQHSYPPTRPTQSIPSSSHSNMPNYKPTGPGPMPSSGVSGWNPPLSARAKLLQVLQPNQNLAGRGVVPQQQTSNRMPYPTPPSQHHYRPSPHPSQSQHSGMPQQDIQQRTASVIAPRYPGGVAPTHGMPYTSNNSPYSSSTISGGLGTSQPKQPSLASSAPGSSPQLLRNPQYVAHFRPATSSSSMTTGVPHGACLSGAYNQSVIRPNVYNSGNSPTIMNNSTINNSSNSRPFYGNSSNTSSNTYYNNQASVIRPPQSSSNNSISGSTGNACTINRNSSSNCIVIERGGTHASSAGQHYSSSSSSTGYPGDLTLQSFLSNPSAPFMCPSTSPSSTPSNTSPLTERSASSGGSGYLSHNANWGAYHAQRGDHGTDQDSNTLSSCQYTDAMRRYNAPITLQALSGLPPGANHLLVKTENGQFQLVSVRMQSPTAAAAAPGTPVVPSTVAAPPTSMSIAQQLPSNSPHAPPPSLPPPHSVPSGPSLVPPISSSMITTTTIPPHPSQQGRIITSSSSNHIVTSWSSSNNNSLVNNSTTSSPLPIISSSAAPPPHPPHLAPPPPSSAPHPHPPSLPHPPPPSVPSSVIMPPPVSASNSQLLSTANNISSSTSSSTNTSTNAAQAAISAVIDAYQSRAAAASASSPNSSSIVMGPPVGSRQPPPPVHNSLPPPPIMAPAAGPINSISQGASVIRSGVLGASSLPPPPPIVVSTSSTGPANSVISSSVVTSTPNSNLPLAAPTSPATFRPPNTASPLPNNNATNNASGMGMMMTASNSMSSVHPNHHHQIHPQYSPQLHPPPQQAPPSSYHTSNSIASSNTTANTVSQMSNETAKTKCKNFLSFLLELSAKQNQTVARNVKNLIQGLIDGKVNEENFADRLQKEVNSQPQPCLVGFLKKSLPHLRHSLAMSELKIEGIKPPPRSTLPAPVSALVPQTPPTPPEITNQPSRKKPSKTPAVRPTTPTVPPSPVRIITPPVNSASPSITPPTPMSVSGTPAPPTASPSPSSAKSSKPSKGGASKSKSNSSSNSSSAGGSTASSGPGGTPSSKSSIPSTSKSSKDKEKKDKTFSSSGYSADDDINDVAAMGGVNLAEESQRILGSTEYVGTQIRSCRDETLIQASPIIAKFKVIAARYGLDEAPSAEVSALLSHAVEERLKTMIEKLSVIAEHRMDVIKLDDRYEITQDVKGQLRFLEELDKLEKKRHDEQEREMLIRAAKSRSKSEDPEQAKLKAKAKEMQRVALEEMRQRDANLTALQAIGPRKKPKLDMPGGSHGSAVPSPLGATGASNSLGRQQMPLRPRLKRVNLRDLLFLLEHDKETMRSPFLYKNLLLK